MRTLIIRQMVIGSGRPKICIPVVGSDDDAILAQAGEAAALGAELIEWRADHYARMAQPECVLAVLERLRSRIGNIPLIFTCRTSAEGGAAAVTMDAYMRVNILAAQSGMADLVDVEFRRGPKVTVPLIEAIHQNGAYVIGSYHDFEKTPSCETMTALLQQMNASSADIVKLAVMPNDPGDVLDLLKATWLSKALGAGKPQITMSMGDMGSISRVCGEYFGSAVTFGQAGCGSAPGQFEAQKLRSVLELLHTKAARGTQKDQGKLLFLVGFMGTGKSRTAARLHELTGMKAVEMDSAIEQREGRPISRIFEEDGEAGFRDIESALLQEITQMKDTPAVISCGGGVTLRPENVARMRQSGQIVLLTATAQTVFDRVGQSQERPNLKNRKTVSDIQALMDERRESYESAADVIVSTDKKTTEQICREILEMYNAAP